MRTTSFKLCARQRSSSVASLPARGPTQSVGIDGELRVDAGGRSATLLTHERVREAATLAADTRRSSFTSRLRRLACNRATRALPRSGLGDFLQKLEHPLESLAVRRAQQPG